MSKENRWTKSPITHKETVLTDHDDTNGETRMDLSSGYYTNEYPLNYKKYKDYDIKEYERGMPDSIKNMRYDDGESYWYLSPVQTQDAIVFPMGDTLDELRWCYAPIVDIEGAKEDDTHRTKIEMDKAEYYESYLEAIKCVDGYSLGNV